MVVRRKHLFKKGHKKLAGRKPGVPNKLTVQLKDCIMTAVAELGSDGKGKEGVVGYLKRFGWRKPELMFALLAKVLPLQITGKDGGPVKLMPFPPEVLSRFTPDELRLMKIGFERLGSGKMKTIEHQLDDANPDEYAEVVEEKGT